MKTFLAVFFGILAAALVLYLIVKAKEVSDRSAKIVVLKQEALGLAAACGDRKAADPETKNFEHLIARDEEVIEELDGVSLEAWNTASTEAMNRANIFHNQLIVAGCFKPDLRPPPNPYVQHRKK